MIYEHDTVADSIAQRIGKPDAILMIDGKSRAEAVNELARAVVEDWQKQGWRLTRINPDG